jgi:hypothetical protein
MRLRNFDVFFAVLVFALFTTVALLLAAIGARVYQTANETLTADYDERTSVLYLAQKLRQNDSAGLIRVVRFGDGDALVFSEEFNGQVYENWLYVADGYLREDLLAPGVKPESKYGQIIMPLESLTVDQSRMDSGLIIVRVTMANGTQTELYYYIRSAGASR